MNDPKIQALCKSFRNSNKSIFMNSWDHYEFSKRTIRTNGPNFRKFKPNNSREALNFDRDKSSMDIHKKNLKY